MTCLGNCYCGDPFGGNIMVAFDNINSRYQRYGECMTPIEFEGIFRENGEGGGEVVGLWKNVSL